MNRIRKWAAMFAAAALLGAVGLAHAQKPADPAITGVEVGDKAPAFKLKDANGDEHSLADLLKKSDKTALVFYRSSDW